MTELDKLEISLEYRPCRCQTFDGAIAGGIPPNMVFPESFDSEKAAAFRFKQHVLAGNDKYAVHCQGVHVIAATINGIRYKEGEHHAQTEKSSEEG